MTANAQIWMLAAAYLSQILILSFITPARLIGIASRAFERFPPEQYPRLYPVSIDEMRRWQRTRRLLSSSIGCAGLIILIVTLYTANHPRQLAAVMLPYSMAQLLPTFVVALRQRQFIKKFKEMTPPAKRSAPLHAWRIEDFVSRLWIALGFVGVGTVLAMGAYLYANDTRAKPVVWYSAIASIVLLILMLRLVLLPLKLTRPDPFMAQEDIFRRRQMRFRALFHMAAYMGACFTFMMLYEDGKISFDFVYIAFGYSVFMQVLSLRLGFRTVRLFESTDHSVYRSSSLPPSDNHSTVA